MDLPAFKGKQKALLVGCLTFGVVVLFLPTILKLSILICGMTSICAMMYHNAIFNFKFDDTFKLQLITLVLLVFAIAAALNSAIDQQVERQMLLIQPLDQE